MQNLKESLAENVRLKLKIRLPGAGMGEFTDPAVLLSIFCMACVMHGCIKVTLEAGSRRRPSTMHAGQWHEQGVEAFQQKSHHPAIHLSQRLECE